MPGISEKIVKIKKKIRYEGRRGKHKMLNGPGQVAKGTDKRLKHITSPVECVL